MCSLSYPSNPFLSIIIPVYNVELYIERCLESCFQQNIDEKEYEIIIVDDGSQDNSVAIIKKITKQKTNVRYIHQSNQGLSIARNNGLKLVEGKYVWFIDSDDWIEKDCLRGIINILDEKKPDLLQIGYRFAYDDESMNNDSNRGFFDVCLSGREAMTKLLIPSPAPFTIYSSSFLKQHDLHFYPNIFHEDNEFKPRVLYYAKSFISLNRIIYNYYQRDNGSITSKFNLKRGRDLIIVSNSLLEFQEKEKMDKIMRKEFNFLITLLLNDILRGLSQLQKHEVETLKNELKNNRYLFNCMRFSKAFRHRIEGLLFNVSFKLAIKLITLR